MAGNFIEISKVEKEFVDALKTLETMHDSIDSKYIKTVQARKARKHFVPAMKRNAKSDRFQKGNIISVTQAKKYTSKYSVRVGVVNNDPEAFPDINAQGLASIIEYGTAERYRQLKAAGFITGRVSTGSMPAAPFLRPAWDANVKVFMDDVESSIYDKVMKEIPRAA